MDMKTRSKNGEMSVTSSSPESRFGVRSESFLSEKASMDPSIIIDTFQNAHSLSTESMIPMTRPSAGISLTLLHLSPLAFIEKTQLLVNMTSMTRPSPNLHRSHSESKQAKKVPVLLLEGDAFFVNQEGICRTFYQLQDSPNCLEEFYDLKKARKTFVIREHLETTNNSPKGGDLLNKHIEGVVKLGTPKISLEINEINHGVFGSAGTGSTTWEASIAMSLFFTAQPHLLSGKIIELGSGIGVGGILLSQVDFNPMQSLTLTDHNSQVLKQCDQNVNTLAGVPLHVKKLDWYDVAIHRPQYDTVLASDVAYLYPDVVALTSCMVGILKRSKHAKIHMFGPYNRGALHEAVLQLRDKLGLNVQVDSIEMHRYRLKSSQNLTSAKLEEECTYASKGVAKFLHVTACHAVEHPLDNNELHTTAVDLD